MSILVNINVLLLDLTNKFSLRYSFLSKKSLSNASLVNLPQSMENGNLSLNLDW